ncbi:MAG: YdeI/OmpD-associated family protein [Candidatus Eremiobacter antarcticus]|nr:YdeI/OmpD-associated family protein [Candidatus Eremiobacteraeota bacterium]MBC5809027.1 YdeI/OmpD-associated family protein [Candidatus Eremiobacteraeota bacterium]
MMIGVSAQRRADAGLKAGDVAEILIEHDTAKRTVTVPSDLKKAMSKEERERFDRFSFTHQKEFVSAIEQAKKPETRRRRIASVIEIIRTKT